MLNFGKPEQSLDDQGNYTATSTMTVVPEFELPEYKGIEVKVPSSEVTEADVEEALNSLAEQIAEFTPVDRAAQKDDVAIIDFKTTLDGKPVAEAVGKPVGFLEGRDGQWMKVEDDQFLPGFASALEGLNAGDSKDITVTIPDTFPITELRGKELVFHATVKEVREKQLPAMDDAFAEKVLPGKNLEELKTALKENLAQRKAMQMAQVEKIAVTEMELYNEVARQARQQKKNLKSYIRELQREGRVHGIRMSLLTAKVLDFLTKEAKVTVDEQ